MLLSSPVLGPFDGLSGFLGVTGFLGTCLLVTVNPEAASPLILVSYLSTATSETVYLTFFPSANSSRSVKLPFHALPALSISVSPVSTPSARSLIVTFEGRMPSLLLLSSQFLTTVTLVLHHPGYHCLSRPFYLQGW